MKATNARLSRRNFILAVGAGTAASAAAVISRKETETPAKTGGGEQSHKGYQLTEHVQNYYRTAKI